MRLNQSPLRVHQVCRITNSSAIILPRFSDVHIQCLHATLHEIIKRCPALTPFRTDTYELSHDGGERDLGSFACRSQAFVFGLHVGVEAHGDQSGHGDHLTQVGPAAADEALAAVLARVAGDGREAGGAAVFQVTKLGHLNRHDQGGRLAHAWDADQDVEAGLERGIGRKEDAQGRVDRCDLALDLRQAPSGLALDLAWCGRGFKSL